jgi:2,3-diketo-5-methylthio-1-phosphopentane phosphatase
MPNLRFFVDFDGTITQDDVIDTILERYAAADWRRIEDEWAAGRIGSRECLTRQFELVKTTPAAFDAVIGEIKVDPYFADFMQYARSLSIPVAIVSDGFDLIIERVLKKAFGRSSDILKGLPVYSNRLKWNADRLELSFYEKHACKHGCANCKERILQEKSGMHDLVVFIGDGLSDRYAAKVAELTFAKGALLDICRRERLANEPYTDFRDIASWLSRQKGNQWAMLRTNS